MDGLLCWVIIYFLLHTLKSTIFDREEVARIFFVSNFLIAREYLEPGTVHRVNPLDVVPALYTYPFDCPHVFKMCE